MSVSALSQYQHQRKGFFFSKRELKKVLRDTLTRAGTDSYRQRPSNFWLVRSEHARASYMGREERRVQGLEYLFPDSKACSISVRKIALWLLRVWFVGGPFTAMVFPWSFILNFGMYWVTLNSAFRSGSLSRSQSRGIISLSFKNGDRRDQSLCWMPIKTLPLVLLLLGFLKLFI